MSNCKKFQGKQKLADVKLANVTLQISCGFNETCGLNETLGSGKFQEFVKFVFLSQIGPHDRYIFIEKWKNTTCWLF